jgi:peptidoglycan/LPS O-acetylase OafA/YrhL
MRLNNFDLIRLFAALQVAATHSITHLKVTALDPVGEWLNYVPGVPVFFIISGFLISMSWERAPSLRQYAVNRVLRIYPALWACLAFSIALFLASGIRPDSARSFLAWLFAQLTFFQFYNPDFLRGFGVGAINGSLWTIPVELQFYGLLPLLASARRVRWIWVFYAAAAAALMLVARHYAGRETILQKLLLVSIVPHLFYFLAGVILRQAYEKTPAVFQGRCLLWALAYAAWVAAEICFGFAGSAGNQLNIVSIILIGMLVVSLAFSMPKASRYLLKNNDISYGIYIYHAPIMNFLLFNSIVGMPGFSLVMAGTLAASVLSWRLIERPALTLKAYSLRRLA